MNNVSINILQAFVSEYAVTGKDAGRGSLLAALAEGAFLIGVEKNRFAVFFFFPYNKWGMGPYWENRVMPLSYKALDRFVHLL